MTIHILNPVIHLQTSEKHFIIYLRAALRPALHFFLSENIDSKKNIVCWSCLGKLLRSAAEALKLVRLA
jgi:hypothetical protein